MILVKLGQGLVEQGAGDVAGHDDPDMPTDLVFDIPDGGAKPENGTVYVDGLIVKQASGCGELKSSRLAVDQLLAEPFFQTLESAGDGRLFQAQAFGRFGDRAGIGKHQEGAQQVPVEITGETMLWSSVRNVRFISKA